ncbi:MAG: S9 family peptidase, partial [bacterium]|nr:S9 family peptidase [bacterium]
MKIVIMLTCFMLVFGTIAMNAQEDPYLWLEDVQGQKSLDWVKKHNKKSTDILEKIPGFEEMRKKILSIYNADTRIAYPSRKGEYLYNFRRNAQHPRGIYRRTTLQEYKKKEPKWELILDIDELAKKEKENWVYKGMNFLKPDYKRALVKLSRGGADAVVVREFDVESRTFLKDGFQFKEAKSSIDWIDKDTLFVGTDFGKDSLSDSGYPRIVKVLKRGQPLEKA